MHCFDMAGKKIWEKNFQKSYGSFDHWHGMSSTPLLVGDTLYQMCLQMENPYIVALDKLTGKERWKVARESDALHESRHSYASPILYQDGAEKQLLIHGADYLSAHKLEDGKELWRCSGLGKLVYTSPLAREGVAVSMSGFMGPPLAVRLGGKGEVTESRRLWRQERAQQRIGSGVIHKGHIYIHNDPGVLECIKLKTGESVWKNRLAAKSWSYEVLAGERL